MLEFDIIQKFFTPSSYTREDVMLGIGDDAAIVSVPPSSELVITNDTQVSGVHFLKDILAYDLGVRVMGASLSDLAAMGAEPAWATLALTLPHVSEAWLEEFCRGFFVLMDEYNIALIGGDTTSGPLTCTVQHHGFVPRGKALLRSGAKVGDRVFVSGCLGDAGIALGILKDNLKIRNAECDYFLDRFYHPSPRIELGVRLRDFATSAIDISDGLMADLNHVLSCSQVGARIDLDKIPLSDEAKTSVDRNVALGFALSAGDDYELCFTVPSDQCDLLLDTDLAITDIGVIEAEKGLRVYDGDGNLVKPEKNGYQHQI